MQENAPKKRCILFATKRIFFPPLNKHVQILLQHRDGPCLLIAIFNCLVLQGKISIDMGVYSSSVIIDMIKSTCPHLHGLKKLVKGYYLNPSFYNCREFTDYPKFLEKLGITLVHAMIPEKNNKNFELISKYDYDSLQMKLIELDTYKDNCPDDLKALKNWNNRLGRQVTNAGIEAIEDQIKNGDVQIFFRNAHFACIYKHLGKVYSLITCKGLGSVHCAWHSLPNASGDFTYFDENFIQTVCNAWDSKPQHPKGSNSALKTEKNHKNKKASKKNDCTIA